jgi:hypothetical protein
MAVFSLDAVRVLGDAALESDAAAQLPVTGRLHQSRSTRAEEALSPIASPVGAGDWTVGSAARLAAAAIAGVAAHRTFGCGLLQSPLLVSWVGASFADRRPRLRDPEPLAPCRQPLITLRRRPSPGC